MFCAVRKCYHPVYFQNTGVRNMETFSHLLFRMGVKCCLLLSRGENKLQVLEDNNLENYLDVRRVK